MVAKTTGKPQATVSKARAAMAVILRDVPAGHNWGWFSREDARMHLQTLDRKHFGLYKIWLERAGRRALISEMIHLSRCLRTLNHDIATTTLSWSMAAY